MNSRILVPASAALLTVLLASVLVSVAWAQSEITGTLTAGATSTSTTTPGGGLTGTVTTPPGGGTLTGTVVSPTNGGGGGGGGGGGSGGNIPTTDYCPNIAGVQSSLPTGYGIAANGDCVLLSEGGALDICANLAGTQTTVPAGYILSGGLCILVDGVGGGGESDGIPGVPNTGAGGSLQLATLAFSLLTALGGMTLLRRLTV
jgi:hypothetical protein